MPLGSYNTDIWTTWVGTAYTSTTQTIWSTWMEQTSVSTTSAYIDATTWESDPRVKTAQEIAEEERLVAEYRQREARQRRLQEEADARAEALLLHHLTPEQVDDYKRKKHIIVCAKSGTNYRIRTHGGFTGNIERLNARGQAVERYCAHAPYGSMVERDHFLAQLLHLRHDEVEFLRVANRTPLGGLNA